MKKLLLIAVLATSISACATKRYGRLQPVSAVEQRDLSCREIAIEMSRVEAFEDNIRRQARTNVRSALGFVADFGIGNSMERNDAERSAVERRTQLRALEAEKGCTAAPAR